LFFTFYCTILSYRASSSDIKRLQPDYSYNLGEAALDIEVGPQCLIVLGERNLFCLSDLSGSLRFMRKLDVSASCVCVYTPPATPQTTPATSASSTLPPVNFILATHSKHLLVHEDVKVRWAAQCTHVPVEMQVAKINGIAGMIVALSEEGHLTCSYLGTEPAAFLSMTPTGVNDFSSFDYETAENEYKSLQVKIKSAIMNTGSVLVTSVVSGKNSGGLILSAQVPSRLEAGSLASSADAELRGLQTGNDPVPSLVCKIGMRSPETATGVRVYVSCRAPLVAVPDSFTYASVGAIQVEQQVRFYMKGNQVPTSLEVHVRATYSLSSSAVTRLADCKFRLPLKLVVKPVQQLQSAHEAHQESAEQPDSLGSSGSGSVGGAGKASMKKITLETNRPCANLLELLPELAGPYASATGGSALAGKYLGHSDEEVFIIQTAKSGSNRYRIQCNSYEHMCLIVHEFVARLQAYHAGSGSGSKQELTIFYKDVLPSEALLAAIERHLTLRQRLDELRAAIEHASGQFRAVQKRLLIKFKDKSPSSLENMDALLEATYRQILAASDQFLAVQHELSVAANSLNCVSSLYALLIGLAFRLSKQDVEILSSIMTNQMVDSVELVRLCFSVLVFKVFPFIFCSYFFQFLNSRAGKRPLTQRWLVCYALACRNRRLKIRPLCKPISCS
jgi:Bardet-Biedl syndrome 9 protein